jgi:hypothetical protein
MGTGWRALCIPGSNRRLPNHGRENRPWADFLYGDGTHSLVNRDTNLRFEGEIHADGLKLTMRHQIFGEGNGVGLPMDAERK